jgi:hypothetical protein
MSYDSIVTLLSKYVVHSSYRSRGPNIAVSPNKSLQRSANHKVLGRGRVVSAPWRAPARPRADKAARGR